MGGLGQLAEARDPDDELEIPRAWAVCRIELPDGKSFDLTGLKTQLGNWGFSLMGTDAARRHITVSPGGYSADNEFENFLRELKKDCPDVDIQFG